MPNIFEYFDYHKYLLDYYNEKKVTDRFFSYRYMSRRLGIDAGYLVKVLQGQKNITLSSVPKFAALLKLGKKETKYFELLVLFSKAKSNAEITSYFEKMLPFTEVKHTRLESDKYEFYQKWYHSAVREVIGFAGYRGDYKALAELILPAIKPLEAKKSVELLLRLGLVQKNHNGEHLLTSRFLTTGEEWHSIAIRKFQEETILRAQEALDQIPREERDISTMTVSLSAEGFEEVRERLRQFRRLIFEIAEKEQHADGAYQLNLQFFPISRRVPGARGE
ncbi:MAG: TIGR02147 family protein [Chitinispirillaceae bacterium]|nr:TIGR02147 family protein [Chitinispirillaceae bacterium]